MGTASLVLGIIALVFSVGGSICALVAIILGAIARKDPAQKGATAGLVMGIIALAWGIIATITCVACLGAIGHLCMEFCMEYPI